MIPKTSDPEIDALLETYYQGLDDLTLLALDGQIDERTFREEAERIILATLLLLFLLGGGDPNSKAGKKALAEQREQHRRSIRNLSDDIFSGRYSEDEDRGRTKEDGRKSLLIRLVTWAIGAYALFNLGKKHSPPKLEKVDGRAQVVERRFTWRLGRTKEHCGDCSFWNGKTLTAEEWRRTGVEPQSPDLECGGYYCMCWLEPTDAPSDGLGGI